MIKMFKDIIHIIYDPEAEFRLRRFYLVFIIGFFSAILGIMVCLAVHVHPLALFFNGLIILCPFVCMVLGYKYNIITICENMLGWGVAITIPGIWLTGGGVQSGVNAWLLYGLVYVGMLYSGKRLAKFVVCYCLVVVAVFAVYITYPSAVFVLKTDMDMTISVAGSIIVVTIALFYALRMQVRFLNEQKKIVERQQEILSQANEAQKSFFANVSHEIRTPINSIIGLNEINLRGDLSPEVEENCENIKAASQMLLSLINDILDLSKLQSSKMEIVEDNYETMDLLGEIINMIGVRVKDKGLQFHIDIDENVPSVLNGDAIRIKQIMINMLTNAVKYTEEGSVTLRLKSEQIDHNHVHLNLIVDDTGIGIKKEDISSLFDAFKRVDLNKVKSIEGTGLGLAISGQLAQLMGGEIRVDSIYHQGSTFTLSIDQEIVDLTPVGRINAEMLSHSHSKQKYVQTFEAPNANILVVDDNKMNIMVAEKLLKNTKVNVDTAMSGTQCLELTARKHYHVILMDHVMPEMDGIETLKRLRKQNMGLSYDVPVIALTANAGTGLEEYYLSQGFQDYLVKPINSALFEQMLIKHLPENLVNKTETYIGDEEDADIRIKKIYRKKLMVTADSVCDLTEEMLEEREIRTMPYFVESDDGRYKEGVEIWPENIFEYMQKKPGKVHSAAPTVDEYVEFFGRALGEAEEIIHVCMTSKTSLGYANALAASESFDNVHVVDSAHLSSGMGLMVMEIHKMIENNYLADEILAEIPDMRKRIHSSFILRDTRTLRAAGRISGVADRFCRLFNIYPVIELMNGYMRVKTIKTGTLKGAYRSYVKQVLKHKKNINKDCIFLTYADCSVKLRNDIKEEIHRYVGEAQIFDSSTSSAISSNCGPGTFGVLFIENKVEEEEE